MAASFCLRYILYKRYKVKFKLIFQTVYTKLIDTKLPLYNDHILTFKATTGLMKVIGYILYAISFSFCFVGANYIKIKVLILIKFTKIFCYYTLIFRRLSKYCSNHYHKENNFKNFGSTASDLNQTIWLAKIFNPTSTSYFVDYFYFSIIFL